jgi:integrase
VAFAFTTGWRITSEVLPLEWRQVDFHANEIRLDAGTTKNREGRVFPMTADLCKLLTRRHTAHKRLKQIEPHVFWRMVAEGRRGQKKPRPIVRFDKQWKAACKAAGLPGRIPHDLRRSAVRNFVRRGISEHTAMKLSGHKTASVFRRYDIVSPDDLRDAARKLDRTDVRLKQKA